MSDDTVTIDDTVLENPHGRNYEVHYRIRTSHFGELVSLCVQAFDYADYTPQGWFSTDSYQLEDDAEAVIEAIVNRRVVDLATGIVEVTVTALTDDTITRDEALTRQAFNSLTAEVQAAIH